jgi:hypothetical protein
MPGAFARLEETVEDGHAQIGVGRRTCCDVGPLLRDKRGWLFDLICEGLPIKLQGEPGRIQNLPVLDQPRHGQTGHSGLAEWCRRVFHPYFAGIAGGHWVEVAIGDQKVPVPVHDRAGKAEARSLPLRPTGADVEKRPSRKALAIGSQGPAGESLLRIGAAVEFDQDRRLGLVDRCRAGVCGPDRGSSPPRHRIRAFVAGTHGIPEAAARTFQAQGVSLTLVALPVCSFGIRQQASEFWMLLAERIQLPDPSSSGHFQHVPPQIGS